MTAALATEPVAAASRTSPRERWWTPLEIALLCIALVVSAYVLWTHVQPNPSFDELWHLMLSTARGTPVNHFPPDVVIETPSRLTSLVGAGSVWKIWTTLDGMPHPPLYFIALRLWRDVFGEGEFAAHALSMACTLIAVTFTFAAGRLAMNAWAALPAAMMLGCAQTQVYLAQEMRPYALAIALTAATLYAMTRIDVLGPSKRRAVMLAALTLPLMLTHYFAVGVCLAIAVYGLLRLAGQRRAFIVTLIAAGSLFAASWLPFALRQARDAGPASGYLHVDHVDLRDELGLLACAPFRLIADRDYGVEPLALLSGLIYFLPWFLLRKFPALAAWGAVICGAIVPVFLIDVAGSRVHLTIVRYVAAAGPPVALGFVGCAWALDRRLAYVTGVTLLATGMIYLYSGNQVAGECPDFNRTISALEKKIGPGDAILFYAGTAPRFYPDMFALTAAHSQTLFPRPIMIVTKPISPEQIVRLPARTWLVTGRMDCAMSELIPSARVVTTLVCDVEVTLLQLEIGADVPPESKRAE